MFPEIKKNFGFGCMRLPMNGDEVDLAQVSGTPVADGGLEIVVQDLSLEDLLAPYEIVNHSNVNLVKVVVKIR